MPSGIGRVGLGHLAECAVCSYLRDNGWCIVATNLRIGRLELDVVARQGSVIAVVEVRTRGRTSWSSGFGSIDSQKRMRIRAAGARLWARRYRNDPTVERLRFDAASVKFNENGTPTVEYAVAAF